MLCTRGRGVGAAPAPCEEKMTKPIFGFVLFGGPLTGATVSQVRLVNELASRGFPVHVWWTMDHPKRSRLRAEVKQYWLFSCLRYWNVGNVDSHHEFKDLVAHAARWLFPENYWVDFCERRPTTLDEMIRGFIRRVCEGVEKDEVLVKRFARQMAEAGVTHVLPTLAALCPWVLAAGSLMERPPKCLVTFQGYEVYANYARSDGRESALYRRLRDVVKQSNWPAVALSRDYRLRVMDEVGLSGPDVESISPGVPSTQKLSIEEARRILAAHFKGFRAEVPLVSFLGRRDAEKGIDLLLYAVSMLRRKGMKMQLAVCGPTLHGGTYVEACRHIAEHLRQPVLWSDYVATEVREALFRASRVVVYPSIYREAFGMVAVEAMRHGTPVVVPDYGGITEAIEAEGRMGGLVFRSWDSGHLAEQIARLLEDDALWRRLSEAGPHVAACYSVGRMADRLLAHMGLPPKPHGA